jgi:hypothetical protein
MNKKIKFDKHNIEVLVSYILAEKILELVKPEIEKIINEKINK